MGVLKKFEQRLEGLVNGTFAKVFKSEVQPVEIAGALQRECDNNATIWNRDRTVVPNDFIVELSTPDFERLSPYSGQLGDELAGMVRDYAKQQRYTFMGPIKVHLEKAEDLDTGLYRVRSRTLASSASQAAAPGAAPAAPPAGRPGGYGYPPAAPAGVPPMPAAPPPGRPGGYGYPCGRGPRPGARRTHPLLDRDQRHAPPDLPPHPGDGPQHRGRRADRRSRRLPCGTARSDRNALDDPGSRLHQRHRGGRAAHHPRYAPRRLADRRGQHHRYL